MRVVVITIASGLLCARAAAAQSGVSGTTTASPTSWRSIPTLPSDIDQGKKLLANLEDPNAKDAQKLCPGYTATNVRNSPGGLSARLVLAGANCNVYGTDIELVLFSFTLITGKRLTTDYVPAANSTFGYCSDRNLGLTFGSFRSRLRGNRNLGTILKRITSPRQLTGFISIQQIRSLISNSTGHHSSFLLRGRAQAMFCSLLKVVNWSSKINSSNSARNYQRSTTFMG